MKSEAMVFLLLAVAAGPAAAKPAADPAAKPAAPKPLASKSAPKPVPGPTTQLAELGFYGDDASTASRPDPDSCPGASDGHELVGTRLGEWQLADWANTKGAAPTLASLRGRVVVVRFWTAGCPFCEKTLPALQKLADELGDKPVTIVGAFHGKPDSSAPDMRHPRELASKWGIHFPVALDRQWHTLRSWWLDGHHRHATSVTFVIGKDGRVVHVHPGPMFYPTTNPAESEINADYQALRKAVLAAAAR